MSCATPTARRGAWAVAVAALLVLTGACDSGSGDGGTPRTTVPSAPGPPGPTGVSTSSWPASQSPTPTGTAPEDPEQAEQDIREAWRIFFDPESSSDDRRDVVENGAENELMISNLFDDPLGSKLRADVTTVSYTSSLHADVDYTLTRDGRRLDTGGPGAAVLQEDTWKIALRTVCGLTRHAKDAPEAPSCA
ncbi:hypothetical protein F7R91_29390 [Streptomyces luteolifulvus]|uniref:Low molecular weight antigen MTB12-like C-terminal domain-containing protein n=1 Tax=Streptomyces luteolifulvus TaxID=2615112 RepID=A0A6H9UUB5_9ACTN|nr:hypothetical protein F7R91_29390 [Streptomyces luteolifulvus]